MSESSAHIPAVAYQDGLGMLKECIAALEWLIEDCDNAGVLVHPSIEGARQLMMNALEQWQAN